MNQILVRYREGLSGDFGSKLRWFMWGIVADCRGARYFIVPDPKIPNTISASRKFR